MYQARSAYDEQPIGRGGMQHYDRRPWWEKQSAHEGAGITAEEAADIAMQQIEQIHQNATQCHADRTRIARKAGRVGGRIPTPTFHGATPAASRLIRAIVDEETPRSRANPPTPVDGIPADASGTGDESAFAGANASSDPNDFNHRGQRVQVQPKRPLSVAAMASSVQGIARRQPQHRQQAQGPF
jgi:hypothetical protein